MIKKISFFAIYIFTFVPYVAYAQLPTTQTPQDLSDVANLFLGIFSIFVPVIIALALVLFLWGIAKYLMHGDNDQERTEAKKLMIFGIIALFVMVSVWGLVKILTGTFGITNPVVPFFPPPK